MFPDEAKEDTFDWHGQIKSAKKVSGKTRFQVLMKGFNSTWFTEQAVAKTSSSTASRAATAARAPADEEAVKWRPRPPTGPARPPGRAELESDSEIRSRT
eukprot:1668000-Prymnesium_polylepis.2